MAETPIVPPSSEKRPIASACRCDHMNSGSLSRGLACCSLPDVGCCCGPAAPIVEQVAARLPYIEDPRHRTERAREVVALVGEHYEAAVSKVLDRNEVAAGASQRHYGEPTDYERGCYETLDALSRQIRSALAAARIAREARR